MATFFERTWKPVAGGNLGGGGSRGGTAGSPQTTYADLLVLNQSNSEREQCLLRYDNMDQTVDISRSLDIIAEDISSDNADDDAVFSIDYDEEFNPTKSQIKTIDKVLGLWEKKTELDYYFYSYARELVKYGIVFFEKKKDGSLIHINVYDIIGYDLKEGSKEVTHYWKRITGKKNTTSATDKIEKIPVDKLVVWKTSDDPFGKSALDTVYKMWRALTLLEDAVVIYRIVRAPERRVFYVDQGNMNTQKGAKHLKQFAARIKQKQINKDNKVDSDYNPMSMQEDYFIGVNSDGRGSRVETLPGGDNLGEISDLNHFNKKLAFGMRVPISWFDAENPRDYNDGRLGTQYISELRYMGYIKRIQKFIIKEIFPHFKGFAETQDVEIPDEAMMKIALPQSFAIYKQNEMENTLLNTVASADQLVFVSKRYALEKYLHLDKADIEFNELQRLMEMGYSQKDIKKFPPHVVANLVYGDGRLAESLDEFLGDSEELRPSPSSTGGTGTATVSNTPGKTLPDEDNINADDTNQLDTGNA